MLLQTQKNKKKDKELKEKKTNDLFYEVALEM